MEPNRRFANVVVVCACFLAAASATAQEAPAAIPTVPVPAGVFRMGNADTGDRIERPVHTVRLDAYAMSATEVTRGQYRAAGLKPAAREGATDELPVTGVSWFDAVAFCNARSILDGLDPVYTIKGTAVTADFSKNGWRLPTEAEWEYAARGGADERFDYAGSASVNDVAWYDENSGLRLHVPGEKAANRLGLVDMSGNAWEWCWDVYSVYSAKDQENPVGPMPSKNASMRIARGGSYSFNDSCARVGFRMARDPSSKTPDLGFRIVRRP